jgi:CheY-like chemotaxis protein
MSPALSQNQRCNFFGHASASAQKKVCPGFVLLVEDEEVVRDVTRAVLEQAGYRVLECGTPQEALRVAAQHLRDIGLLLTDVVMPGMNGVELAQRLSSLQPGLITVFMSGYANRGALQNAALENVAYIQKPFTIDTLLSGLAAAFEKMSESRTPRNLGPGVDEFAMNHRISGEPSRNHREPPQ